MIFHKKQEMKEQRLFIGNLPADTSENDLLKLFKKFKVSTLEIKRKQSLDRETLFAYVNLPQNQVGECLQEFGNRKWRNFELKVEVAKESFLERLKRERTEKAAKNEIKDPAKLIYFKSCELNSGQKNKKIIFNDDHPINCDPSSFSENEVQKNSETNIQSNNDLPHNSDSSSIPHKGNLPMFCGTKSVQCDEVYVDPKPKKSEPSLQVLKKNADFSMKKFEAFSDVWKDDMSAGSFHCTNETKSSKVAKPESAVSKKGQNSKYFSEEKRKTALEEKWNTYTDKKNVIRKALKNLSLSKEAGSRASVEDESMVNMQEQKPNKITLFAEGSSEEDSFQPNFEVKPYLEGDKNLKMLNLEEKFSNDDRFKLNERFTEGDKNDSFSRDAFQQYSNLKWNRPIVHYDPTKPDPKILEKNLQSNVVQSEKKKKLKKKQEKLKDEVQSSKKNMIKPEVSKKKHYSVSDSLKEAFKKTEDKPSFSLTSLFDYQFKSKEPTNVSSEDIADDIPAKKLKLMKSPFKTISESEAKSESEDSEEEAPLEVLPAEIPTEKILGKCSMWGETFFFKSDDSRLKEAEYFYRPSDQPDTNDFGKRRSNLRGIVKKKIQNSQRDRKLFRQKLGGKISKMKFRMRIKKVNR